MNMREEFEKGFKAATGKDAKDYKGNPKGFAAALNGGPPALRVAFRDAVTEAQEEDKNAAGLANLFG